MYGLKLVLGHASSARSAKKKFSDGHTAQWHVFFFSVLDTQYSSTFNGKPQLEHMGTGTPELRISGWISEGRIKQLLPVPVVAFSLNSLKFSMPMKNKTCQCRRSVTRNTSHSLNLENITMEGCYNHTPSRSSFFPSSSTSVPTQHLTWISDYSICLTLKISFSGLAVFCIILAIYIYGKECINYY